MLAGVLVGEIICRTYWRRRGVPFFTCPSMIYRAFYPELNWIEKQNIRRDDDYDALVLGGSVIARACGSIAEQIMEKLEFRHGRMANVHNAAVPAHTSLNSYYKYLHLADKRFDLIIVYHGINEVRANLCPSDLFEDDYTHYSWYAVVNSCERWANPVTALPFTAALAISLLSDRIGLRTFVPTESPRSQWLAHGADVRTAAPFQRNIEAICDLARDRAEPVLLVTFAMYIAPGYTQEKFSRRELDYSTHFSPIEMWGRPDDVVKAVGIHNAILRKIAAEHEHVYLVDEAEQMPRGGTLFNDVCHLTHEGCSKFAEDVVRAIERFDLEPRQVGPRIGQP